MPGDLEGQRALPAHHGRRMPPSGCRRQNPARSLSAGEIEKLGRWIDQGAKWQPHWSFIPPRRPPVPQVANRERVRNPIDAFILARLEREGLEPSGEAERGILIRRVTLDLTGLPPTPR